MHKDSNGDIRDRGLPPGPATVAELYQWHHAFAQRLIDLDKFSLSNVAILMSTEFSGMGTAELAMHQALIGAGKQLSTLSGQAHIHRVLSEIICYQLLLELLLTTSY